MLTPRVSSVGVVVATAHVGSLGIVTAVVMIGHKPMKIRGVLKPEKIGIVASNLKDVLQKGCDKLKLPVNRTKVCLEADGTIVEDEDYYQTIESNTYLVLVGPDQTWTGGFDMVKSNIEATLLKMREMNLEDAIREFLDDDPSEIHRLLVEYQNSKMGNIDAEERDEDVDWFRGIEPRFKTKSQVMFVKAQERVRGYFSKTKESLSSMKSTYSKDALNHHIKVIQALKDGLVKNNYHGVYFKRTSMHTDRLCDATGWFRCQGMYDRETCDHSHLINPYSTKENMVLFSTWNLDHVIEKSRSVIPGLNEAIRNCPKNKEVNIPYFYDLLFTRTNLKLVDIRCHNKGKHTGKVDKKRFYRKPTGLGS